MMTPRQRWLCLFNRQKPDRIPTDYWATGEVTQRLMRDLGCATWDALLETLHIDAPQHLDARRTVTTHPDNPKADIWGIEHVTAEYGDGAYSEAASHPLAEVTSVADVHAFKWPNPDDHDWDDFAQQLKTVTGRRIVRCGGYEPFLLYCQMRGMEQAMMDLLIEPDIADAIFDHLFDYHYRANQRMFAMGKGIIDMTYVAEDLGSQASLLMGLKEIRHFILPRQKKMADLARSFGIHIFYHTDGAAREVIPDLINVTGIEILNPIQWRCPGMEREGLVRDFADRVIFHGSIDNQQTLAFGSADDVVAEVRQSVAIYRNARWICAPCHNLQPITPTENIMAMYETIHEAGRL
jgi:uroporphyrinogen decarboxylase